MVRSRICVAVLLVGIACNLDAREWPIVIEKPAGGEVYFPGQSQMVVLGAKTKAKMVLLELSRDGGQTFEALGTIDNSIKDRAARNRLAWIVTEPFAPNCVIRATSTDTRKPGQGISSGFGIATSNASSSGLRFVLRSGDTMSGPLTMSGMPTGDLHAANKKYVDDADSAQNTAQGTTDAAQDAKIETKVARSGDTMAGALFLNANPTANLHAVTKQYVDTTNGTQDAIIAGKVSKAGDSMTGALILSGVPTADLHAVTKKYADDADTAQNTAQAATDAAQDTSIATKVAKAGDTMTGPLTLSGAPTVDLHAATKLYVDSAVSGTAAWTTGGNAGTTPGTNFLGTTDLKSLEIKVNNNRALLVEPGSTPNLVGGFSGNSVTIGKVGASISGGGQSGKANSVIGDFGFIGGGYDNISAFGGVVGGGWSNSAGMQSVVGGGMNNSAANGASVSGGAANTANGQAACIGGGGSNSAGGVVGTIGGGLSNATSADYATVAGGTANLASGSASAISGGSGNLASGRNSTVCGGNQNRAQGDYSFAIGRQARAIHNGTFIWADSSIYDFNSAVVNELSARATGGVRFVTGIDGSGVPTKTFSIATNGDVAAEGVIESKSGGVKFPDGTVQTTAASGTAFWATGGNVGTTAGTHFLGTTDNQALEIKVNSNRVLRLEPNADSPNLIAGYKGNTITSGVKGSVIGGGGATSVSTPNRIYDDFSVVAGGAGNLAGIDSPDFTDGWYSVIGGGLGNKVTNGKSTIAGGQNNEASGGMSFIGGGYGNKATGTASVVAGGVQSTAGTYAFVGGGLGNQATGQFSVVTGGGWGQGLNNLATGKASTIPGGEKNTAGGKYSFAAGRRAKVASGHDGTLLWADATDLDFSSGAVNEFAARATGGVRFVTAIDGSGVPTKTFSISTNGNVAAEGVIESKSGGVKFPDSTVQTTAAAPGIPSGSSVLGDSMTPPTGYTYSGDVADFGGNIWNSLGGMSTARANVGACVVVGKIFAIGGQTGIPNVMTNVNESYDPTTLTWSTKAPMPTARRATSVAAVNGKIYVIGGFVNDITGYLSTNEEYDQASNTWTTKAPMPTARADAAVAVINNKIYVIGGTNGGANFGVNEVYDPATDTWQTKASMTVRAGARGAVVNGMIYVIGGWSGAYLNLNQMYDPQADTWSTKAAMPTNRSDLVVGVIKGKIYAVGGLNAGTSWMDTNEEYDPLSDVWVTRPDLPVAVYGSAGAVLNGKFHVVGGYNGTFTANHATYNAPAIYYVHRKD